MQTDKHEVMELLQQLPDDSSLEEIQYHLYVRQKIQRGLQDVGQGKVHTQEEVEKRMKRANENDNLSM
jgi:predicted transcriptional regulator